MSYKLASLIKKFSTPNCMTITAKLSLVFSDEFTALFYFNIQDGN